MKLKEISMSTPPRRPRKRKVSKMQSDERPVLIVSTEAYAKLLERFDAPAQPNARLLRTMRTPAPWT
jgi:uncharacterized protein (DUF1778 family)